MVEVLQDRNAVVLGGGGRRRRRRRVVEVAFGGAIVQ